MVPCRQRDIVWVLIRQESTIKLTGRCTVLNPYFTLRTHKPTHTHTHTHTHRLVSHYRKMCLFMSLKSTFQSETTVLFICNIFSQIQTSPKSSWLVKSFNEQRYVYDRRVFNRALVLTIDGGKFGPLGGSTNHTPFLESPFKVDVNSDDRKSHPESIDLRQFGWKASSKNPKLWIWFVPELATCYWGGALLPSDLWAVSSLRSPSPFLSPWQLAGLSPLLMRGVH